MHERRPFTPEDQRYIAEAYAAGIHATDIAETLKRRRSTIQQWMAAHIYPAEAEPPVAKTNLIKANDKFCALLEAAIADGRERDPRRLA